MPKVDFRNFNRENLAFDVKSDSKKTTVNGKETTINFFIISITYNYLGPNRGENSIKGSKSRFEKFLIQPPACLSPRGFQPNNKFGGEQIMCSFVTDLGILNSQDEPITTNNPTEEDINIWKEVCNEIRDSILKFVSSEYKQFKFTKSSASMETLKSQPIQARVCLTPDDDQDGNPVMFLSPSKYIDKKINKTIYTVSFIELRLKGRKVVEYEYKFKELYGKCIAHRFVADLSRVYVGSDYKIRIQPTIMSSIVYDMRKSINNQQEKELEEHKKNIDISNLKDYDYKDEDTVDIENDLKDLMNENQNIVIEENNHSDDDIVEKNKKKKKKRTISNDVSDE